MATNAKFKLDGTQYDFEKDAGVVKYGSGTLKTALDNLSSVRLSPFGKQLLNADADEFRRLLQVGKNYFVDEAKSNDWRGFAAISSAQKKFGNYSLKVSNNGLSSSPIYFGGDPFTISFWARYSSAGTFFKVWGMTTSFAFENIIPGTTTSDYYYFLRFYTGTTAANNQQHTIDSTKIFQVTHQTLNTWRNYEITYNGSALKVFVDGVLHWNISTTVAREGRRIAFGTAPAYIDSVRILDGVCGTGKKASAAYALSDYPNNTVALLNFE